MLTFHEDRAFSTHFFDKIIHWAHFWTQPAEALSPGLETDDDILTLRSLAVETIYVGTLAGSPARQFLAGHWVADNMETCPAVNEFFGPSTEFEQVPDEESHGEESPTQERWASLLRSRVPATSFSSVFSTRKNRRVEKRCSKLRDHEYYDGEGSTDIETLPAKTVARVATRVGMRAFKSSRTRFPKPGYGIGRHPCTRPPRAHPQTMYGVDRIRDAVIRPKAKGDIKALANLPDEYKTHNPKMPFTMKFVV
ncbi:hypothetical protein BCR34DRAFT_584454 [Clohesyomyces aquaticus]|uniref:Uncharacterized protein n=1 Tax=Clohesyomyces aquaticus TaxID=1231657 RepID=A0A1Y2A199_9PLEO|nr:hypothetical protein BCR34DRAFT_584454 [Clohesyomyces aquaticus]